MSLRHWLTRHRRASAEVSEELRAHLEERTDDLIEAGVPVPEARRRAAIELGNRTRVTEDVRGVWISRTAERIRLDLMWAWRGIRARRGRAGLACGLLAAALAINLTAFVVIDAIAFDRAPYPNGKRLVVFGDWLTAQALAEWRKQADLFTSIDGSFDGTTFILGDGPAEHLRLINVTPGLFDTLGVRPRWGRTFVDADARRLDEQAVIVSLPFARRHFGSPEAALDQVMRTAAQPFRVIGVMSSGFGFPSTQAQIWRAIDPAGPLTRDRAGVSGVARIAPDISMEAVQEQVGLRGGAVNAAAGVKAKPARVSPYGSRRGQPGGEQVVYVLLGAAACLLLTAAVSVLNLELTGAIGRTRMAAIQSALGATRGTLVRVTVFEGVVLLIASAIGAWLLTALSLPTVVAGLPPRLSGMATGPFDLDVRAAAYGALACFSVWLIVGVPTAVYASRLDLSKPLKLDDRSTPSRRTGVLLRRIVTLAQVSVAVLLVIVGSLLARTYKHLTAQPKGFDSANLIGLSLELPSRFYPSASDLRQLSTSITNRLHSSSGVVDAVEGPIPPSTGNSPTVNVSLEIDGHVQRSLHDRPLAMAVTPVDPHYFQVLGVPLRAGRWLASEDDSSAVLIGDGFARGFWGTADAAIGRVFEIKDEYGGRSTMWGADGGPHRIVGVIADYRTRDHAGPYASSAPWHYLEAFSVRRQPPVEPLTSATTLDNGGFYLLLNLLARVDSPTRAAALASAVKTIEPRVVVSAASVDDVYADQYEMTLLLTRVVGAFAIGALLIALIGIYGVMAFLVTGRRREIGIRMALGADPRRIGRFVMASAARLVVAGLVVGIAGAMLTSRAIASLLFGVAPTEPSLYAGVALTMVATALLATWLPMRRASGINPVDILRSE